MSFHHDSHPGHGHGAPYGGGPMGLKRSQESSTGPMRTQKIEERDKKGPIAAPVKSACTFCRSRKSRCDGNKPCAACVARGRIDDCIYTISRRGGKPKPKIDPSADLQSHLTRLFQLTDMPYAFRRPGGMSGLVNEPDYADGMPFASGALLPPQQTQLRSQLPPAAAFASAGQYPPQPDVQHPHVQQQRQQQEQQTSVSPPFVQMQMPKQQAQQQPQQPYPFVSAEPLPQHQPQHQPQSQPQQLRSQAAQHQPQHQQHPAVGAPAFQPSSFFGQAQAQQVVAPADGRPFAAQQPAAPPNFAPAPTIAPSWQGPDFLAALAQSGPSTSSGETASVPSFAGNPASPFAPSSGADALRAASTIGSAPPLQAVVLPEESVGVRSLLIDYYKYLYRFIPVIPGPRYIDILSSAMQPDSSFILALQCVLPLLRNEEQPIGSFHNMSGAGLNFGSEEKRQHLKERTTMMERKANEAIDALLERADSDSSGEKYLELIQTLCVMVIYEYGTGRAIKSRLKADQALGLAMAQGLHKLKRPSASRSGSERSAPSSFASTSSAGTHSLRNLGVDAGAIYEMRKRCWWVVWSLVLWSAYNTGRIPTIRADDPRVRSEVPAGSDPVAWSSNISSLQALLLVQDRVLALAQSGHAHEGERPYRPSPRDVSRSPRTAISPDAASSAAQSPFSFGRLMSARPESDSSGEEIPTTFHTLPSNASRQEILDSMQEIDAFLQDQIRNLEKRDSRTAPLIHHSDKPDDLEHVEEELEESLRTAAAVQLYTSSLTLHIGQAFQGASLFERKLCFLNSINDNSNPDGEGGVCCEPMPNAFYDELVDVAAIEPPHGIPPGLSSQPHLAETSTPSSGSSPSWTSSNQARRDQPIQQDLYARGPFLPRVSLQRCIHASKKLLDIAKRSHGQSVNPNPFNCCSFVLISFVLLMQALAVHGGFGGAEDEDEDDDFEGQGDESMDMEDYAKSPTAQYSHELLQSGRAGQAFDGMAHASAGGSNGEGEWNRQDPGLGQANASSESARQAQLRGIWTRVREARDTLIGLGKHWEAVIPMADEVNLCLETSQLLLSS
ncbi:hypothetical protein ACQY0O_001996 [Thecaphora frezii]